MAKKFVSETCKKRSRKYLVSESRGATLQLKQEGSHCPFILLTFTFHFKVSLELEICLSCCSNDMASSYLKRHPMKNGFFARRLCFLFHGWKIFLNKGNWKNCSSSSADSILSFTDTFWSNSLKIFQSFLSGKCTLLFLIVATLACQRHISPVN